MSRRHLIWVALAMTLVVAAGMLLRAGHDSSADAAPATSVASGTTDDAGATTSRFAHDEAGARAAAISFATASQRWMYLDDADLETAVRAMATDAVADELAIEVIEKVDAARAGLVAAPRVWWLVQPLATKVDLIGADEARASVWVVSVLSATGVAVPQSDWRTVTLELHWQHDSWRVSEADDIPGPTPVVGEGDRPWTAERLDDALDGFTRIDASAS